MLSVDIFGGDGISVIRPWLEETLAWRRELFPDEWEQHLSDWVLLALLKFAEQSEGDQLAVVDAFLASGSFERTDLPDDLKAGFGSYEKHIENQLDASGSSGDRLLDLMGLPAPHLWALAAVWSFSQRTPHEQERAGLDLAEAVLRQAQQLCMHLDPDSLSEEQREQLEDSRVYNARNLRLLSQLKRGKISPEQFGREREVE